LAETKPLTAERQNSGGDFTAVNRLTGFVYERLKNLGYLSSRFTINRVPDKNFLVAPQIFDGLFFLRQPVSVCNSIRCKRSPLSSV